MYLFVASDPKCTWTEAVSQTNPTTRTKQRTVLCEEQYCVISARIQTKPGYLPISAYQSYYKGKCTTLNIKLYEANIDWILKFMTKW